MMINHVRNRKKHIASTSSMFTLHQIISWQLLGPNAEAAWKGSWRSARSRFPRSTSNRRPTLGSARSVSRAHSILPHLKGINPRVTNGKFWKRISNCSSVVWFLLHGKQNHASYNLLERPFSWMESMEALWKTYCFRTFVSTGFDATSEPPMLLHRRTLLTRVRPPAEASWSLHWTAAAGIVEPSGRNSKCSSAGQAIETIPNLQHPKHAVLGLCFTPQKKGTAYLTLCHKCAVLCPG